MSVTTPSAQLKIGEVSRQSQVSVKTIRYYEDIGLVQAADRSEGGFRLFGPEVITRLAFIKRAQTLGLSLSEIHDILVIHDQGNSPCHEVKQTLHHKIDEIQQRIDELTLLKHQLQNLLLGAEAGSQLPSHATICPIIEAPSVTSS